MILESNSPKETQKIAIDLAQKIIKTKKGAVITLEGELGAGKTTFTQGFADALGIKDKIKSPTFVLMKKYSIGIFNFYHIDCYRVKDEKDLKILELNEILNMSHNIVLIEWPERVSKIIPKNHITVHIDHVSENERKITIT